MSFFSDIAGNLKSLYRRLPFSGNPQPKKRGDVTQPQKIGFQGSTASASSGYAPPSRSAPAHVSTQQAPAPVRQAPGRAEVPIGSFDEGETINPLERYTDFSADDLDRRLKLTNNHFASRFGFNPPESTVLAIATNPNIKDGMIPRLFAVGEEAANKIRKIGGGFLEFGQAAARPVEELAYTAATGLLKNRAGIDEDLPSVVDPGTKKGFDELGQPERVAGNVALLGLDIGTGAIAKGALGAKGVMAAKGAAMGVTAISAKDLYDQYQAGELGAEDTAQALITGLGVAYTVSEIAPFASKLVAQLGDSPLGKQLSAKLADETGGVRIPGTGKTAPEGQEIRGLSLSVEEKAVANGLADNLGDLPTYDVRKIEPNAKKVVKYLADDVDTATKIALGDAEAPSGLFPEEFFVAVSKKAAAEGDVGLLKQLANSKLAGEGTVMGQRIRALGELNPEEPVAIIKKVQQARKAKASGGAKIPTDLADDEVQAIATLTDAVVKAKTAIEAGADRLDYGRAKVALNNFVNDLENPTNKMSLIEQAKNVSFEEFKKDPLAAMGRSIPALGGVTKSIKASLDNSSLLRQGWKTMFTNNKEWRRNSVKSFSDIVKTFGGQNTLDEVNADILSRPNALNGLQQKAKLAVGGVIEEAYPTSLPERIPILGRAFKASEAAYTGFLQRMRADVFDKYIDIYEKTGVELSDERLLGLGKIVNSLTGRGNLGATAERVSGTLNNVFFSPRNLKSNIDLLAAHAFDQEVRTDPVMRKLAATNLLKVITGSAAIMAIADAVKPGSVEWDWTSSNAGKIRTGSTRFDVTGGSAPIGVLATRLAKKKYKSSTTGEIKDVGPGFGLRNSLDLTYDFFENKLSPIGQVIRDVAEGQQFAGKELSVEDEIKNLFMPLIIDAGTELENTPDSANTLLALIAESHGISVSNYLAPDNPLIMLDKEFQEDTAEFSAQDKFNARYQWRDEIESELDRLSGQKNKKGAAGWSAFKSLWAERNTDLREANMSPDSDNFNKKLWDEEMEKLMKQYPVFADQYKQIPQKLLLR